MKPTDLQLVNFNWNDKSSKKTHNFIVTVKYKDHRVFKAKNSGDGTPNEYKPFANQSKSAFEREFKFIADKSVDYVESFNKDFHSKVIKHNAYGNLCVDYVLNQLINDHFIKELMVSKMHNCIILLDQTQRIFEVKLRNLEQNKEFIRKKVLAGDYPEFQIMNDMDEEAQLKIWRSSTN
tara:strand:+ start:205 stop:741 length:537 start_codon:yes stop_codon:yes gene_type:complete